MNTSQQRRALDIVKAVGALNFQGNITPHLWYRTLRATNNKLDPNGKAHLVAITILAELVYWYRPRIDLDHRTGQIVSIHKRFPGDKLRRSIPSFMAKFGLTDRQVRDALEFLAKEVGVITKELRTIGEGEERRGNVLFLEIVPEVLRRITLPEDINDAPQALRDQMSLRDTDTAKTTVTAQRPFDHDHAPSGLQVGGSGLQVGGSGLQVGGSGLQVEASDVHGNASDPEVGPFAPTGRTIKINVETPEETPEETEQTTTNDEAPTDQTVVVAALQRLGLSRSQAVGAARTHQLTLADIDLWATWLATLRGVNNPVAVFVATIKQQPRPPHVPAAAPNRSDDPNKYVSGALSNIVLS